MLHCLGFKKKKKDNKNIAISQFDILTSLSTCGKQGDSFRKFQLQIGDIKPNKVTEG